MLSPGHAVLEGLAGLKSGTAGSRDADGLGVMGVAAGTFLTVPGLKGAEAAELNLLSPDQALGNGVNGGIEHTLGVFFRDPGALGGGSDQFGFIHCLISSLLTCENM